MENTDRCCDFCGRPLRVLLVEEEQIHYRCSWCGILVFTPLTKKEETVEGNDTNDFDI